MQKKNAWVVLCAVTPFINVAMKVCNIKRKIRIGLFPTWYFMRGFGQKKFGIWQKKEIKELFFIFLRPLLFFQVHEEMYFESGGRVAGGNVHDYDIFCKVSTATTTNWPSFALFGFLHLNYDCAIL